MNEPTILYAGDKIEWTESLSDYPPSGGWTLKYILINSSSRITITSVNVNNNHKITLTSDNTTAWPAGSYTLQAYVEHTDGTVQVLYRRTITIEPNLIIASTYDFRTHAQKTLEAIEASIEGIASAEVESMQISTSGGSSKSLQYMSMEEKIKARAFYKNLVEIELQQEKINAGLKPGNKILISFK